VGMYRTMGMGVTLASAAGAPSGLDGPHPIASHALVYLTFETRGYSRTSTGEAHAWVEFTQHAYTVITEAVHRTAAS
jgi:hypothetical protein